jgi:hypothetical protein
MKGMKTYLLIVEYDIWEPDDFGRNINLFHSSILVWIPPQLVIVPFLNKTYLIFLTFISILIRTPVTVPECYVNSSKHKVL